MFTHPEPELGVRAPQAGLLHAAPGARAGAVAEHVVVDPDHPRLKASTIRSPFARFSVQTEAPRPNSESLASPIASSSEATVTIGITGPKISSRMMRMSWVTPVRTAGRKKAARRRRSQRRAGGHGVVHQLLDELELLARDHRADLGGAVERVALAQLPAPSTTPATKRSATSSTT